MVPETRIETDKERVFQKNRAYANPDDAMSSRCPGIEERGTKGRVTRGSNRFTKRITMDSVSSRKLRGCEATALSFGLFIGARVEWDN